MTYNFQLTGFPEADFELLSSFWSGKPALFKNGTQLEQAKDEGKPFLIPTADENFVKAYLKQNLPDLTPTLEINGEQHLVTAKLKWYELVLGYLPVLLLFIGGGIGGAIGVGATLLNLKVIFRQKGNVAVKYLKVLGVIIGAYILYAIISYLFQELIK